MKIPKRLLYLIRTAANDGREAIAGIRLEGRVAVATNGKMLIATKLPAEEYATGFIPTSWANRILSMFGLNGHLSISFRGNRLRAGNDQVTAGMKNQVGMPEALYFKSRAPFDRYPKWQQIFRNPRPSVLQITLGLDVLRTLVHTMECAKLGEIIHLKFYGENEPIEGHITIKGSEGFVVIMPARSEESRNTEHEKYRAEILSGSEESK